MMTLFMCFIRGAQYNFDTPTVRIIASDDDDDDGAKLVPGEFIAWNESDGCCLTCGAAPNDCHDYRKTTWYSDLFTTAETPTDADDVSMVFYFKVDEAFITFIKDKLGSDDEVDLCDADKFDDYLVSIGITVY